MSDSDASQAARGLTVIGASAGTGKTHRLTDVVWDACRPHATENPSPISPERIVAVTFTEKAAGELADRIRTKLFAKGAADEALRLSQAYLGTVHAVGLRLIGEHALEAGQPPEVSMLPKDGGEILRTLLERAVPPDRQARLEALVEQLGVAWDNKAHRSLWQDDIFKIVDAARANRIAVEALPAMAERSWLGLKAHLPAPTPGRDFDAELRAAAQQALATDLGKDTTDKTAKVLKTLREIVGCGDAAPAWRFWLKLAHLDPSVNSRQVFEPLRRLGDAHPAHPRLHADLESYIKEAFAAAADVLRAFGAWKAERRVIDWNDMLDIALTVLDVPEIAADLGARLGLVVVDELQDSGPLQLALFARLHAIVGRSVWVGDPKQCIFEWNGADPGLMDALLSEVAQTGGESERLGTNYRSRAALVEGCSALFGAAFAGVGMTPADVAVTPCKRRASDPPTLAGLAPLGVAFIDVENGPAPEQLAATIAGLLARPDETPVLDRRSGAVRSVKAEDIAVLYYTNNECEALAVALRERGIPATAACGGVMQTAEGRAAMAALRLLLSGDEPLAEAELEALAGFSAFGNEPDRAREAWLAGLLTPQSERTRGRWTQLLDGVRRDLPALSPSAALDRAFAALDLPRAVLGWGEGDTGPQRQANLDALRRMARAYEAESAGGASAATLSGLARYLSDAHETKDRDAQHTSDGAGSVVVTTYHRAKGLEWPVVILASLDRGKKGHPFDVWPESAGVPSLANPLAGRWIRYWPWPYGNMDSGALRDAVGNGPVGRQVAERERRERLRLLYVGFTRARDHLVFAIPRRAGGWKKAWLDELEIGQTKLVALPDSGEGIAHFHGPSGTGSVALACRRLIADDTRFVIAAPRAFVRPANVVARPPRRIAPSSVAASDLRALGGVALRAGEVIVLGEPLGDRVKRRGTGPVDDAHAERVGLAVHGFLASDAPSAARATRIDRIASWLAGYDLGGDIDHDAVLASADRFWAWVAARWPGALLRPEVPVRARVSGAGNARTLVGTIDLLVEAEDRTVVIDHKTAHARHNPGHVADKYATQLGAYRLALSGTFAKGGDASGRERAVEMWLHFPMAGLMVALTE